MEAPSRALPRPAAAPSPPFPRPRRAPGDGGSAVPDAPAHLASGGISPPGLDPEPISADNASTCSVHAAGTDPGADLILCGDVCYEKPMSDRILPWLRGLAARGAEVWLGDPGRAYLPTHGLEPLAEYVVPTSLDLEDRTERATRILRLLP